MSYQKTFSGLIDDSMQKLIDEYTHIPTMQDLFLVTVNLLNYQRALISESASSPFTLAVENYDGAKVEVAFTSDSFGVGLYRRNGTQIATNSNRDFSEIGTIEDIYDGVIPTMVSNATQSDLYDVKYLNDITVALKQLTQALRK